MEEGKSGGNTQAGLGVIMKKKMICTKYYITWNLKGNNLYVGVGLAGWLQGDQGGCGYLW